MAWYEYKPSMPFAARDGSIGLSFMEWYRMTPSNDATSGKPTIPREILVAIDSSPASKRTLTCARHIAAPGAHVTVISVAENPRTLLPTTTLVGAALEAARDELLGDAADALAQAPSVFAGADVSLDTRVIDLARQGGDVAHALANAAGEENADLIVVGARQHHGLLRWVEGTVSEPLMRLAQCPLLIVPASDDKPIEHAPQRILFAVDGSESAARAVRYGAQLAGANTRVRAIYVVDRAVRLTDLVPIHLLEEAFVEEGNTALAAAGQLLASIPAHASASLVDTERTSDDIAHAIVREAEHWKAELIVMGTHGRRGLAQWFVGSVAGRVARIARTPLLLVPVPKP